MKKGIMIMMIVLLIADDDERQWKYMRKKTNMKINENKMKVNIKKNK